MKKRDWYRIISLTIFIKREVTIMNEIKEFLPFLIPLVIVEFGLLAYTLHHILTHKNYKKGNRALWLVIVILGMNYVGPILYFLIGKEDA